MKLSYLYYAFACCLLTVTASSCSDFLNNDLDDNQVTIEEVFQRKNTTEEYLANVYSYMRPQNQWSNETPWTAISDELDVTYPDYVVSLINLGSLTPDKGWYDTWTNYYKGIRSASYFINHVDNNIELTKELKQQYKAEAKYLRAWFYFCLVRQYGPVVLLPEDLIAAEATIDVMTLPRRPIKDCFDYIIKELDTTIKWNTLPEMTPSSTQDYGRITIATCKALKSRVCLYAASDFYNNDRNKIDLFKNFKDGEGNLLLNYRDADRIQRWQAAADAAKEVIDMPFTLFEKLNANGEVDPYASYQMLFQEDWNSEVIFAKPSGGFWEMDWACSPRTVGAWSGWGPTQRMVDAYYTKNGLPIDKDPAYSETGTTSAVGDDEHTQKNTFKMYTNREPRFYISIAFNLCKWFSAYHSTQVQFYYGGNSGKTATETRNYSQTGYLCRKFINPNSDIGSGKTQEHAQIYFRLGEIYLNYVEALNEVDYAGNLHEILTYLNLIRQRAGIPVYGNTDGKTPTPANQDDMREAIRRERRIELAFEEHRYFDCIRWGIAKEAFGGNFEGMNINGNSATDFNKRVVFENRSFENKNFLWPINLTELYKGKKLVQNPGWSGE